jgi:hypothetical protein
LCSLFGLLLAAGCWLLAILAIGCWLLAAGCWLLAIGCWVLAIGCWLLAISYWLLVEVLGAKNILAEAVLLRRCI